MLDFIIAWEQGEASPDEIIDGFAALVKNGMAWSLQGCYGRQAASLIKLGYISETGEVLKYPEE